MSYESEFKEFLQDRNDSAKLTTKFQSKKDEIDSGQFDYKSRNILQGSSVSSLDLNSEKQSTSPSSQLK